MRNDFNNSADHDYFISVNDKGDRTWWLHGVRHRHDGPAEEFASGARVWWLNGEKHREDGPAEEHADGAKTWWFHGQRHRDDGPAYIDKNGWVKAWYRHGKMHRDGGPAMEAEPLKWWKKDDKLHREDGPAFEHPDPAYSKWYIDGIELKPHEVAQRLSLLGQRVAEAMQPANGVAAPATARFRSKTSHKVPVPA
jgi:hypothetical protein